MITFLALSEKKCVWQKKNILLEDVAYQRNGTLRAFLFKNDRHLVDDNQRILSYAYIRKNDGLVPGPDAVAIEKKKVLSVMGPQLFFFRRDLLGAPVHSESGFYFGKVFDVELNSEIPCLDHIVVVKHFWEELFKSPLYIPLSGIVEFQKKQVIIKDAFLKVFDWKEQSSIA